MDDWNINNKKEDYTYRKSKVRIGVMLGLLTTVILVMLVSFIVYKSSTKTYEELQKEQLSQNYEEKKDLANNQSVSSNNEIDNTLQDNRNSTERFGTVLEGDSFAMLGRIAVLNYKVVEKYYDIGLVYDNTLVYVGYNDKLPLEVLEKYGVREDDTMYEIRDFKGKHFFVKKDVEFVDV